MSLDSAYLTDDEFQCSICLDLFTNPASTPCGHSFCMRCINKYWDGAKVCQCPLCKKKFQTRPDLHINRTLREITEHFKSMKGDKIVGLGVKDAAVNKRGRSHHNLLNDLQRKLSKPFHHHRNRDGVQLTSSLPESQSLLSANQNDSPPEHIDSPLSGSSYNGSPMSGSPMSGSPHNGSPPHYDHHRHHQPRFRHTSRQRRFTLSGAADAKNLPLCDAHNRAIMLYCQTDQMCICPECEEEEHPDHDVVTIEAQWKDTQVQLNSMEQEIEEKIKQRVMKLSEIRESMSKLEVSVQRETAGSLSFFSSLVSAVENAQSDLLETLEMKRRAAELKAESTTRQIQLELDQLRTRQNQLEELNKTHDHIQGLQTFPSLTTPVQTSDWTDLSVTSDLGAEVIYRSLSVQLLKFHDELQTIAERGFPDSVLETSLTRTQPKVRGVQEYAVDITFDTNSAHPRLIVSEDMKSVKYGDRTQMLPDNPERFDRVVCVLGNQEIFSGRHYWEVEVGGKTDWDLGVAKSSINRKGKLEVTPANGYWFLSLRDKKNYAFRTQPSTDVDLTLHPHKIGVFVDYENGQVSFYNVDAKIHIYTFNDWFYDSIFPFFSPCTNKNGKNEAPLIITPVFTADY